MLYLIGLGLGPRGISEQGLESLKKCKRVYLENYTVDFPYSDQELFEVIGKKFEHADREFVESLKILDEAEKTNVALLVYGSPLTATTHITIIQEAKKSGIRCKIVYATSILDAVAGTGLQLYKFGKIASMPTWKKNYEPDSFITVIKENQSINAHTLILIDIGLEFGEALAQLNKAAKIKDLKLEKIIVGSRLGVSGKKIFYDKIENLLEHNIKSPYCIIIPSKLHFIEKEFLEDTMED